MVLSTTAAGTISQTARGFLQLLHKIRERGGRRWPSPATNSVTAFGDMSKTTH